MAKALFHKGQRVFVRPVGTWAVIEKVMPQWVKGVEEPLRVFYDVGLGRDFGAGELVPEARELPMDIGGEAWRLERAKNRQQIETDAQAKSHPHPGTYPVVVTDSSNWGGWRVPAAEYDRDPQRIELQARIIAAALPMLRLTRDFAKLGERMRGQKSDELKQMLELADEILKAVYEPDNPADEADVLPTAVA